MTAAECYEAEINAAYARGERAMLDALGNRQSCERAKPNDEAVHVYVMVSRIHGDVKIGISQNPEWRRKELSKERRGDLALAWFSEACSRRLATDIERRAHETMRNVRLDGEWFDCSPDEAISAVRSAERSILERAS